MANEEISFTEYEKMNNDFSKFEDTSQFSKVNWIVTEKIHGANFSFHTDGKTVCTARRRGLLENGENFFNCLSGEFMTSHPAKMIDVYQAVCTLHDDKEIAQVSVYGELFGGKYVVNGKSLNNKNVSAIQNEIQYSPNIEWNAFDISYRAKENEHGQEYVDADEAMKIFEHVGIFHVKPLFIGAMHEALDYELGFDSTIPATFGLPPLEKGTNKAEGIVVKPLKNMVGVVKGGRQRVIVKIKLDSFIELCRTPAPKEQKVKKRPLQAKIFEFATEMRLLSAISKIGAPTNPKVEEEIREEFITDVFADVKENSALQNEWDECDESTKTKIKNTMKNRINGLLTKYKKKKR